MPVRSHGVCGRSNQNNMAIQWFPGHMRATQKAIAERVKAIDVVIELLDARLPGSSASPMVAELTAGKPALKVLNKQDLADPARTALWLAHYNAMPGTRAIGLDASIKAPAKELIKVCHELAPRRGGVVKPMRVLICGIPNVGKSTLINTLTGKKHAKTGDEAGITKLEQRITLADDFYLYDTPGVLWPRIIVPQSGYNLAASGAIGRNAFDEQEVAIELAAYLQANYATQLEARYKLKGVADMTDEALLIEVGRKRSAVQGGGKVDMQKASEALIYDFRASVLGRVTLETPEEFALWLAAGQEQDAKRQVNKDAIELDRKIRFKQIPRPG
jgi:ribosome biogenesis GTPase A